MEIILYFKPFQGKIMKIPSTYRKHAFSAALVIALAASLAIFLVVYRRDSARASETASLARYHWLYAVEMNDDMAVIDWSKNLGNLDNVKAFQASINGKISGSGGNQHLLPASFREGISFIFPDTWIYGWRNSQLPQSTRELILVFRFQPGPFRLFLLVFLACVAAGFVAGLRVSKNDVSPSAVKMVGDSGKAPIEASPLSSSVEMELKDRETALIFLDKQFIIRRVSPRAALLLNREPEYFLNLHLLDLSPEPRLMRAIESAEQTRLSDVFKEHPGLSVSLKHDSQGIFLYLESSEKASGS
jgi:hypothetical protein